MNLQDDEFKNGNVVQVLVESMKSLYDLSQPRGDESFDAVTVYPQKN